MLRRKGWTVNHLRGCAPHQPRREALEEFGESVLDARHGHSAVLEKQTPGSHLPQTVPCPQSPQE
jgi:hypothetical protein